MNEDLKLTLPDGRMLAYAEYGDPDGAVVLSLHGTPGTRHLFSLTDASARNRGLRLIAPDRAGIGGSDDRPGHSIGGHVEDIAVLADHLGADRFAVLGFSGGGPYAAEAVRQMGHRIQAVALISAYALGVQTGPGQRAFMGLARISVTVLRWACVAIACGAIWVPLFARIVMSLGVNRNDRQIIKDPEIHQCLLKGMAGVLWSGRGTARETVNFSRGRFPPPVEFDAPVRIWHGTDDRIVAPEAALCYARMFPGASITLVPGAGHFWGLVGYDEVLEALAGDLR